jgi:outer membrane protein OmpA-like peptidoglycan-associated protein/opacity protein-like surface antigen
MIKSVRCICFVLASACIAAHGVQAQSVVERGSRPAIGGFSSYNFSQHVADFRRLPGVPSCCPNFESGNGPGFMLGGLYEFRLMDDLSLGLRADYANQGGTLSAIERTVVDGANGSILNASIEHLLDSRISSIGIQPLLGYRLFGGLSAHAGTRVGYVLSRTYTQKEVLLEPAGSGTFENGLRQRNFSEGSIEEASSLQAGLVAGLSYTLPLNDEASLFLVPEMFYHHSLTPVVENLTWKLHALTAGAAIKYVLPHAAPEIPKPVEPVAPPPPPPPRPALAASVEAVVVNSDGSEGRVVQVTIEEFETTNLRPLLPYMFFDEGATLIASRYATIRPERTSAFALDDLHDAGTLGVYYQLLNIVGLRMRQHAKAKLTLVGCNANTGMESGNETISRQRAETVKSLLVDTWGIAPGRIEIRSRNLPERPSRIDDPDGIVENRRVELSSTDSRILEPVRTTMVEREVTPPLVKFIPLVRSEAGVRSWSLRLEQDRAIRTFDGRDPVPSRIEWNIRDDIANLDSTQKPLRFTLSVEDREAQTVTSAPSVLPIEHITLRKKRSEAVVADKEIARYSLILFDFDKSDISAANRAVAGIIQSSIREASTVTITGYADRMGEPEYNRKLSLQRAENTAKLLKTPGATILGLGTEKVLYDNDTPEGRFYSRTVDVVVETPVQGP